MIDFKSRRRRVLASPLGRRILAVNLLAPVVLVVGLFYLDTYRQGLIRGELDGMATHAKMMAAALGESAVVEEEEGGQLDIDHDRARHLVRRLAEPAGLRARMFDRDGDLAADSRVLKSGGPVHVEEIATPSVPRWSDRLRVSWEKATRWMPVDDTLPLHPDKAAIHASDWPEVMGALAGRADWVLRRRPEGGLVLAVAVPVQRYKHVVGAVLITAEGTNIARSLFQVRLVILEMFALSLVLTIGLSLYLAGTIARPIRRLALSAERVRHRHGRRHAIPDLSGRGDEIGELSVSLKETTEALWRRMDAIEAFAADVAHEIKNPLTSLRSAVETAARITDPEKRGRLMEIIVEDVARLNRLITDISDASRIDAEMQRIETQPVSVSAMLDALFQVFGATAEEGGPVFRLNLPEGDRLVVQGVETRLVQVLRNLVANAVSFSPPGGEIILGAWRDGSCVCMAVDDQGPGIPPEKLDAVFDRFYTERPESEAFGTHSGLGLSISRQIAEAHGGIITAANRQGGGARFVMTLPAFFPDG